MRRSTFLFGLMSLAMLGGGCAAMRGMSAKHAYREQQTQNHVYKQPLKTIWPQARQLLFEQGFEVKDTDGSNAETEWKVDPTNSKQRNRYLLSGVEVSDAECKVQFTKATEFQEGGNWGSQQSERDLGLEFDLIKKADPDAYAQIEAEGDKRAEAAKKE
jgi:hypothetical protein